MRIMFKKHKKFERVSVSVTIDGDLKANIDFGDDKDPWEVAKGLRALAGILEGRKGIELIYTRKGEQHGR